MRRKARSFREPIRYKVKLHRQKHSRRKLKLQDQAILQLKKVGEEISLLEEMQIVPLLPDLVKRRLRQRFVRVAEMPSRLNHKQLYVSSQSKDQFQRLPVQMLKVKKRSLKLLRRSNSRLKWCALQRIWKRTARNRSAYMPASSGLTMKSSGSWSWSFASKCWKTGRHLHLLHPLLLQRQPRLPPVQESTDILKPQDLQTSNRWRYRQDIRDLVAMKVSWTELLPGWTQLIGNRPGHCFVLSPDLYVCRHSLDCASFECQLVLWI